MGVMLVVGLWWRSFTKFCHEAHVFFVDLGLVVAQRWTTLSRAFASTILGNVTSSSARRTHNAGRNVRLVWTEPSLVFVGTAIGTTGTVGLPKSSVQLSQLSELHPTKIVVTFRNFDALPDDILDPIDGLLHRFRITSRDKSVQWFVLTWQRLAILTAHFAFLDGTLATDYDLGTGVLFHGLEGIATWSNQQTDKVDVRMLFLRDEHLVADTNHRRPVEQNRM